MSLKQSLFVLLLALLVPMQTFAQTVTPPAASNDDEIEWKDEPATPIGTSPSSTSTSLEHPVNSFRDKDSHIDRGRSGMPTISNDLSRFGQAPRDLEGKQVQPGKRTVKIATYDGSSGVRAALRGSFATDVNKEIKTPLSVQNITWTLTEPAVAQGMQQALVQSLLLTQQQMLAEQSYFNQLSMFPEVRDPAAQAYIACVANASEHITPDEGGWSQAIHQCMSNLSFASEPSNMGMDDDSKFPYEPNSIYLSNYIFTSEIIDRAKNSTDSGDQKAIEQLAKLRVEFQKYIGDYRFTMGKEAGATFQGNETDTHEISVQKINPEKSIDEFVQTERLTEVYGELFGYLSSYCYWLKGQPSTSTPSGGTGTGIGPAALAAMNRYYGNATNGTTREEIQKRDAELSFYANPQLLSDDRIRKLSVPSQPFDEGMSILLFRIVDNIPNCEILDPKNAATFAYKLDTAASAMATTGSIAPKALLPGDHALFYSYARSIAYGQVLQSLNNIDRFISALTLGSFTESFVRPRAQQLIFEAVGGMNRQVLEQSNAHNLAEIKRRLTEYAFGSSGKGGATVMNIANEGQTDKNPLLASRTE